MARYEKIYTLRENKNENRNCPVKFVLGALLKDTEKNQLVAQLKFTNISDKHIQAVEIDIITYDANGAKALPEMGYTYNGLSLNFKDTFGDKTPVKIRDKNTVEFEIRINKVICSDGTVWHEKKEQAVISAMRASEEMSKIAKSIGDESAKAVKKLGDDSLKAAKKISDESAKAAEKISVESAKTLEKAGQVCQEAKGPIIKFIRFIGALLNTAIFIVLGLLTAGGVVSVMESGQQVELYMVICVGLCAFLSFPLFGHLLRKTKHSKAFRIARWIIILLIMAGAVYLSQDLVIDSNIPGLNLPGDTFIEEAPEAGKSELAEA